MKYTVLGTRWDEDVVPEAVLLERILDHDRCVADVPDGVVALLVEGFELGCAWERRRQRFVQQLDRDDHVLHLGRCVFPGHHLDDLERLLDRVAGLPSWFCRSMPRVVVAVLRAGSTMQVDPYFEIRLSSPADGLAEIAGCTLDIWLSWDEHKGPI